MTDLPVFSGTLNGTELMEIVAAPTGQTNEAAGVNYQITTQILAQLLPIIPSLTRVITTAGPQSALPTDVVLIINQTVGAPFTLNVDWSTRIFPLTIVDGKGDAAVNNISIVPAAGQIQQGTLNNTVVIDGNGGLVKLTPLPASIGVGAY